MARTIAITGGIGSGKSSLSRELRALGYVVLDADQLAREVLFEEGVAAAVRGVFGNDVFVSPGVLNREKVSGMVFADPALRQALETIIHPAVVARFDKVTQALSQWSPDVWLFYEIPLLFEARRESSFEAIVSVVAPEHVRRERVVASRGMSPDAFSRVVAAQVSDEVRMRGAHVVVDNSGDAKALREQVCGLLCTLRAIFSGSGT